MAQPPESRPAFPDLHAVPPCDSLGLAVSVPASFRVSVVIPVYNAEKYVARAAESALAQPETEEVLLVEDDSPDQALAVCRRLESEHPGQVRLFRHPDGRNHGAGPSRNLGIRKATQPFIAFLDADDYYLPGRFARDAELLLADDTLDGVYNALGTDILDEAGRQWWTAGKERPPLTCVWNAPPPERLFFEMQPVGTGGWFSFDATTVRRAVFDKAAWFSDLRLSQDTLLGVQLAAVCRLAGGRTQEPVAMRGVHGGNRIQAPAAMQAARRAVYRELLAWARRRRLPPAYRREIQGLNLRVIPDWKTLPGLLALDPQLLFHPRLRELVRARWRRRGKPAATAAPRSAP